MVVDGSEPHLEAVLSTLQGAGWNAVGSSDPWEAITLVSRCSFTQIILDLDLAGDGVADLSSLLLDDPGLRDLPVIFFSSAAAAQRLPRPGDLCLQKPHRAPELVAALRKILCRPFPAEEQPEPRAATRFVRRRRDTARSA